MTKDEIIRSKDEHPPGLSGQGMRADETRDRYGGTLRMMACKILEDVLDGDFEGGVEQTVKHGREDPGWIRDFMPGSLQCIRFSDRHNTACDPEIFHKMTKAAMAGSRPA